MDLKYYEMAKENLENHADTTKVAVVQALVDEKIIQKAEAEEWCESHTIVLRKKSFFRTITNKWLKTKEDEGLVFIVVKKVV